MLRLACDSRWERLPPEALTLCEHLLAGIRQYRPEWLVRRPNLRNYKNNWRDWRYPKGMWWRFLHDTDAEAQRHGALGGPTLEQARAQAAAAAAETDLPFHHIAGAGHEATYPDGTPGWEGRPVAAWRADADAHTWAALFQAADHPYRDWLLPYLDVKAVASDRASWRRFWLQDVSEDLVPQQVIVSAVSIVQRTRKTTAGTPVDAQLANYLLDADALVTADKALVDVVEKVRVDTPRLPIATGWRLRKPHDPLAELDRARLELTEPRLSD
ncbi:hypothetical protein [Euzebya pacifica]|nr:hypothetical protein [Euzebya pacifica]